MIRVVVSLSVVALCGVGGEPSSLEARIAPLAKAHKGKVAVAVKHLGTGDGYHLNADDPMPTASLIKLPVMVEAYWQAHEGRVDFGTTLTLKKDDKVPGSGVLTEHFSDGATFTVRDAVRLMIAFSDNTATNLVLDQTGIRPVNDRMDQLGLKETRCHSKVFKRSTSVAPARSEKYGLGSTTAREMVRLLELIEGGKVVTPAACQEMIEHLKKCDDKDRFPLLLPAGVAVAHKTGSVTAVRTDAGILYLKGGPVAVCVLTDQNEDKRWARDNAGQVLCAKIAKEVHDHFAAAK